MHNETIVIIFIAYVVPDERSYMFLKYTYYYFDCDPELGERHDASCGCQSSLIGKPSIQYIYLGQTFVLLRFPLLFGVTVRGGRLYFSAVES